MNQDYQWELILRKLQVRNEATSLPALRKGVGENNIFKSDPNKQS